MDRRCMCSVKYLDTRERIWHAKWGASTDIFRVIKCSRMRLKVHVTLAWERGEIYTKYFIGKDISLAKPKRRWIDNIRKDLKRKRNGNCRLDSSGSGQGPVAGYCECCNKRSGVIIGENSVISWATNSFSIRIL